MSVPGNASPSIGAHQTIDLGALIEKLPDLSRSLIEASEVGSALK
jgi:hypothetical protein